MAQATLVVQLAPADQEELRRRLDGGDFAYRALDHAHFSARGEGVVVTLYRSGKLVVQGAGIDVFAARYLDETAVPPAAGSGAASESPVAPEAFVGALVGCDEAGKGDYLGPLVAVALRLEEDERAAIQQGDVRDSKRMTDEAALRLGGALRERFPCAVEVLDPPVYNSEHARVGNLNEMLADLHARAIRAVARPDDGVLVDKFAAAELLERRLAGLSLRLDQRPRAESEPAVAAASVVARGVFLERLAELSREHAVDLHKGAGPPADRSARRFLELHGRERLGQVAKLHFKNTERVEHG